MNMITSSDGTKIAHDQQGDGPPLILVDGAMNSRSSGSKPQLVKVPAPHFSVYIYDRRGRGDSGDTQPYAVEREIEVIEALIAAAGGSANLLGSLSRSRCVSTARDRVMRLARYEAPYNDDPEAQRAWGMYIDNLTAALATNRRGDAVALFMAYVGVSTAQVDGMRHARFWAGMEALAPTLAYDHTAILGADAAVPSERAARVAAPSLVMAGSASFPFMQETARALSSMIPHAELRILEGQRHDVDPEVLAPALVEFFGAV